MLLDDRFSRALDYNCYRLVEMPCVDNDQTAKAVAKSVSMLQAQMKSQVFNPID